MWLITKLVAGAGSAVDVVLLDAQDGLRQMADALAGRKNIAAVHLFARCQGGRFGLLTLTRQDCGAGADLARIL
jgi:hypothetical protein